MVQLIRIRETVSYDCLKLKIERFLLANVFVNSFDSNKIDKIKPSLYIYV